MAFLTRFGFNGEPFISRVDTSKKVNSLLISNGIYDEIKIDETLDSTNSIIKEDWTLDTAFDAKFKNNLEGGNFQNQNVPLQFLRFKRRKVGELKWQTMIDIPFDKNIENYNVVDYFVESSVDYEYALVGVTQSTEGTGVSSKIEANYLSLFLTGRDENGVLYNYPLRFDSKASDITLNEDKVVQKTLSSKYPAILCGESKYYSGNIVSDLISPSTIEANGKVNMKAEKVYRDLFEEFIHSGKPMLIRNHSMYILGNLNDIKKNPIFDECAFGIFVYNMSFNETANAQDMDALKSNNLTYSITTN